jgi:hypothetical protein
VEQKGDPIAPACALRVWRSERKAKKPLKQLNRVRSNPEFCKRLLGQLLLNSYKNTFYNLRINKNCILINICYNYFFFFLIKKGFINMSATKIVGGYQAPTLQKMAVLAAVYRLILRRGEEPLSQEERADLNLCPIILNLLDEELERIQGLGCRFQPPFTEQKRFLLSCVCGAYEEAKTAWDAESAQQNFIAACFSGNIALVQWVWSQCAAEERQAMLRAREHLAFQNACRSENIALVQWVWDQFAAEERQTILREGIFQLVCRSGNIALVQWMLDQFAAEERQTILREGIFQLVCLCGNIALVQWMLDQFAAEERQTILREGIFQLGCLCGNIALVQWVWDQCAAEEHQAMLMAENYSAFKNACDAIFLTRIESESLIRFLWDHLSPESQLICRSFIPLTMRDQFIVAVTVLPDTTPFSAAHAAQAGAAVDQSHHLAG